MSSYGNKGSLEFEALHNGVEPIGSAQAVVAFTVIANLAGTGRVRITAVAHGKKKNQVVQIIGGAYAGIYRIVNVSDADHIDIVATFGATAAGNLLAMAYLNGFGFIVKRAPVVISALVPEDPSINATAVVAEPLAVGDRVYLPFTSIAITAGDIDVVRSPIRANLTYTNR